MPNPLLQPTAFGRGCAPKLDVMNTYLRQHVIGQAPEVPISEAQFEATKLARVVLTAAFALEESYDVLYTWFVPARARLAMPCFDQPDLKGRWTVTLEHPAQWQSVANGVPVLR